MPTTVEQSLTAPKVSARELYGLCLDADRHSALIGAPEIYGGRRTLE